MNDSAWLAERRQGVGASEVAAVCGLSAFGRTPFDVYLDKLGLLPPWEGNEATRWGHRLEAVVADAYAEREGVTVAMPERRILRHPTVPYCLASPDRVVTGLGKLLQCKTSRTAEGWGPDGSEEVPEGYYLQCQWEILAAGELASEGVDLAVLIGGQELRVYPLAPSPATQDLLLLIVGEFWGRVERRDPPPLDYKHPDAARLLNLCYRPRPGREITLDGEAIDQVARWEEARQVRQEAERAEDEAKARLIGLCGEAEYGILPDGRIVHRKVVTIAAKHIEAHTRPESQQVRLYLKKART